MAKFVFILVCYLSITTTYSFPWWQTCTFDKSFIFSTATSSYQIEGAWNEDGKGLSNWDFLAQNNINNMIVDNSTGNIACNSYHKYKKDVSMLKYLGVNAYRFSISWSRLLPNGKAPNGIDSINPGGRDYYNNLINELLANNITPMVTLFHWDLPFSLTLDGGFQNENIVEDFAQYADLVFQLYGDRVKYWFTFNEPKVICMTDSLFARNNPAWQKPGTGYICNKHLLLSHAMAYRLYHAKYNPNKKGKVSIVVDSIWYESKTIWSTDIQAADRFMQFMTGMWVHPIYIGDYPKDVKTYIKEASLKENLTTSKLPTLTNDEIDLIHGTSDFYSVNYYTSRMVVKRKSTTANASTVYETELESDAQVELSIKNNWDKAPAGEFIYIVPEGFGKLLKYIKKTYANPQILITENGIGDKGGLDDKIRIKYVKEHLKEICKVKKNGVKVFGYTLWSLMDNFEWVDGYQTKFGLYSVDFTDTKRPRTPKKSAEWYKELISTRKL